jgi:hypothetical protein
MRPKERIPIFLGNIDFTKLEERWQIPLSLSLREKILEPNGYVIRYWMENYDQRFGQMLINLELIEDHLPIWVDEDLNILLEQGCPARDVVMWGSIYDENGNALPAIKYRIIRDMNTSHINAILKDIEDKKYRLPDAYIEVFTKEIEYRNNQNNDADDEKRNNT